MFYFLPAVHLFAVCMHHDYGASIITNFSRHHDSYLISIKVLLYLVYFITFILSNRNRGYSSSDSLSLYLVFITFLFVVDFLFSSNHEMCI